MKPLNLILPVFLIFMYALESKAKESPISVEVQDVTCNGRKDGAIEIIASDKLPESFTIEVKKDASKILRQFTENSSKPFLISDMEAGNYSIIFRSGKILENISANINSPDILKANVISIESVSGENESLRASIKANPTGGTPPYSISWSENTKNQKGAVATNLPLGIYLSTINDVNNCGPVSATIFLFETEIEKYNTEIPK